MEDKFRVKLLWRDRNGDLFPDHMQMLYQVFVGNVVPLYNRTADTLNPYYAKWNEDYDESKDGEYNSYICNKMNNVLAVAGIKDRIFDTKACMWGEDGPQISFIDVHGNCCSIILEPVK